ncbi:trehalose-6-phosphate synthase [Cryptosporidium canis]|nr:trehalose-6-phosphate synthase [Cryptosporidium canis]
MISSSSVNSRAEELSKILKDEQEWLRTRRESRSTLIIVSLELPVKIVRLDGPESGIETGRDLVCCGVGSQDHSCLSGCEERRRLRFGLKSSQHSLMRTLHGHRNELARTVRFIGWPGIHVEREDEKEEIRELLESIDCVPVFPPETEFESFNEFCQLFMWPLFHNVLNPEELSNAPFDHEQWRRYHQMNMLWSSVITPIVSPEHMDMVWINDYHLLLLCQYLTRRVKGVNIGLFLHIPFPSFEIFRCLPVREELLRSILMADLVGFHFFPYAKQFLSSCKRLLGLDHYFKPGGLIGIDKTAAASIRSVQTNASLDSELHKLETIVRIGHVHIQCDDILQNIALNKEILNRSQGIRDKYKGHYIFVSIDRLDQLSGLQLKLRAFDNFLQNYPYIKAEQPVVLIQYIFPTNTLTIEKRDKLIQSLVSLSNEINQRHSSSESFGNPVIELKYGPVTQEEKYSLFLSGDCLFDTSVRDGLNLNPFEYIICKDDSLTPLNSTGVSAVGGGFRSSGRGSLSSSSSSSFSGSSSSENGESSGNDERLRGSGRTVLGRGNTVLSGPFCRLRDPSDLPSLIISEFTGCSNTLSSPYRVNPWNMMNVVETLDKAVCCQKGIFQEKRHHWNMDKAYLLSHSTVNWAKEFIMDLCILSERKKKEMLHFYNTTFGIGPSLKDIRINLNSQHLSLNLLSQVYRRAEKSGRGLRLFLLDNEGTLTPDFRHLFDRISSSNFCSTPATGEDDGGGGARGDPLLGSHQPATRKGKRRTDRRTDQTYTDKPPSHSGHSNLDSFEICKGTEDSPCTPDICIPPVIIATSSRESPPSLESSSSNHETMFTVNSNCTSIEALNLENSITNTSISSILNGIPREPEAEEGPGADASGQRELRLTNSRNMQGAEESDELSELYLSNEISCAPPVQVVEALRKLSSSPSNVIIIFSGREKHLLDEWFGEIDNIGLCAEHGYYLKLPKSIDPVHPNVWRQLNIFPASQDQSSSSSSSSSSPAHRHHPPARTPLAVYSVCKDSEPECNDCCNHLLRPETRTDLEGRKDGGDGHGSALLLTPGKQHLYNISDWKNITLQLMEQYVLRTQGSYIENKGTALIFQFKYCEPYFGTWQAKELSNYLNELLISFPVNVISGNDYVEVRLQGINKGVAVQAVLDQICSLSVCEHANKRLQNPPLEMILCIGDDRSDEDMFSVINHFSRSNRPGPSPEHMVSQDLPKCEVFNVVIGKHTSLANYFLHSTEEVSDILQTLTLFT